MQGGGSVEALHVPAVREQGRPAGGKSEGAHCLLRGRSPAPGGRRPHPRERILHVFEQLESQSGAPDFQGCRYLAVQIELKDQTHPASRVAHRIKAKLTAFFRAEAEQGGASDPDLLARQLILVFDGASARAGIGADTITGLIAPTVVTLLDTAGVR